MVARADTCVASSKALAVLTLAMLAISAGSAWPQAAPQPTLGLQEQGSREQGSQEQGSQEQGSREQRQSPAPPPADPAPAPFEKPGLINEMGKLFGKILPLKILPLKSPGETMDDLNSRAKDAGDALSRLAKPSSMISERLICPISANRTPDCKLSADKLCQSKGYKEGKSLNTDSAETCSPKVLIPGRKRKPDDCRTDTYVTSALCQ
jgi:hypothetical protein